MGTVNLDTADDFIVTNIGNSEMVSSESLTAHLVHGSIGMGSDIGVRPIIPSNRTIEVCNLLTNADGRRIYRRGIMPVHKEKADGSPVFTDEPSALHISATGATLTLCER